MTTISARIVADSVCAITGVRLTTMLLRYPRWIHAEGRTHRLLCLDEEVSSPSVMADRDLSRNASSSRAIPVSRLIQDVLDDPAIPMFWGKNQRGMQAGEEINELVEIPAMGLGETAPKSLRLSREQAWLTARDRAITIARAFSDAGYHKQIVNRLLEPFSHINVVVSATEWSNFFALRIHEDAEPHIRHLAEKMAIAMTVSKPRPIMPGDWHTPFVLNDEMILSTETKKKISVARCARTSYLTHDGQKPDVGKDMALHDALLASTPLHASPAEHVATPFGSNSLDFFGNFRVWKQYRKFLPNECL